MKRDQQYDENRQAIEREHQAYAMWLQKIEHLDMASREDLEELLRWPDFAGNILVELCKATKIKESDISWLLSKLPAQEFAYNQISAYELLRQENVGWEAKYLEAVRLKANWAISVVLRTVPIDQIEQAQRLIDSQQLGPNVKGWQYAVLDNIDTDLIKQRSSS